MRSTPTTPYSDFIYLMEKALCNTGECRIYGEYNTIKGAYVEYIGKENLNYMFNYASSIWYSGSFGQTEPWEVCIVTADLNKEAIDSIPLVVDFFMHRRKFIVVIDNSIVNDCYFAGNTVKAYSDEEKLEKLCRIKSALGGAIYGFIDRVIFPNDNSIPREIRINIINTISSYICSWYLYNFARASRKILREVDEENIKKIYKDKVSPEELEKILDWYDKDMEYCRVFDGSFPDIDRVEGASFRYRAAFGINVLYSNDGKRIDVLNDTQENLKEITSSIKDTIKNINDVIGADKTPEPEEEKPAPKKRTTKKSTTSTKKTTTSRKSTKKEETVDDTKD